MEVSQYSFAISNVNVEKLFDTMGRLMEYFVCLGFMHLFVSYWITGLSISAALVSLFAMHLRHGNGSAEVLVLLCDGLQGSLQ